MAIDSERKSYGKTAERKTDARIARRQDDARAARVPDAVYHEWCAACHDDIEPCACSTSCPCCGAPYAEHSEKCMLFGAQ